MELAVADLEGFARLVAPDDAERRRRVVERVEASVAAGQRALADTRVARAPDGDLRAVLVLAPRPGGVAFLHEPRAPGPGGDAAAATLVPEVLARARALGLAGIWSRPAVGRLGPRCRDALLAAGFRDLGERIEFQAPVPGLPRDDGSPLAWRTMGEVGRDAAAAMLGRVAEADPHGEDERRRPRESLEGFLAAPALTSGPECTCVGYEGGRAVAFVCAQVDRGTGWSRIAYLGLVPGARGRGLGRWVHRHGFRMLREQGGALYHGGTAADNRAMLQLFRRHGCREHARMHQLEWRSG